MANFSQFISHVDHSGYVNLRISDNGRKMIDRPSCDVDKNIDSNGYLPNYVFRANWFPEFAKSTEYIHIPLTISLMESSDGQLVGLDLNGQFFAITGH
jgi:hypothetical protein